MRKLMICVVCALLSLPARAGFIDGIRISGYDRPFIVAIDKLTFLSSRDKVRDFIQAYRNH